MDQLGSFIQHHRKKQEYGLREFAKLLGMSAGNYCAIESGARGCRKAERLRFIGDTLALVAEDRQRLYMLAYLPQELIEELDNYKSCLPCGERTAER